MYNSISDILGNINVPSAPLEEEFFDTPYFEDYLPHERFHHSHKGCKVEMVQTISSKDKRISINKICHTHDVRCSKTGWELGWYLGNNNKNENSRRSIKCAICGKEILVYSGNSKYCPDCYIIHNREAALARYIKNKKLYWDKKYGIQRNDVESQISNNVRDGPS